MEITEVKVFPVQEEKLKAFVSVVFDRCFMVNDIKIIQGRDGLFISMPSRRKKNGRFKDVAHPLNNETRQKIEGRVLEEYERAVGGQPREERPREPVAAPEPQAAPPPREAPPPRTAPPPPEAPAAPEPVAGAAAPEKDAAPAETPEPEEGAAAVAEASEAPPDEEKSLEEVTEMHLRDSFWST